MILSTIVSTAAQHYHTNNNNNNNININRNQDHHQHNHERNHACLCRNQELCTETSCSCPRSSSIRPARPTMRHSGRVESIKRQLGASARSRSGNSWRHGGPVQLLPLLAAGAAACLLLAANQALAFPSGAPEQACKDLKPGHGVEPASGSPPFELTQDKLQVEAGDQIKVTLSSPSKANFKGLIVQALNEKGEPKGKFLPGKGLKTLDSCSAVTHSDREAKKTATLVWEAPSELKAKEAFVFKATVVQKFDEFHMNIRSTLASESSGAAGSSSSSSSSG